MTTKKKANSNGTPATASPVDPPKEVARKPRSITVASNGITTAAEFARLMSALMSDVIEGNVTPAVCSAAVNAGGKLLKVVEMTHRLGTNEGDGAKKLMLTSPVEPTEILDAEVNYQTK